MNLPRWVRYSRRSPIACGVACFSNPSGISDFFDAGPVLASLGRARAAGHDVVLVQVVLPDEVTPQLEGDLVLEDSETGATVELTADATAIEAYLRRFAGLCDELRVFARRHGGSYVRHVVGEPLLDAARRLVGRTID